MKDLTTSVYAFEDLIQGNFLYVDKTDYIWHLLRPAKELYFLSRPRRFGKSLLISTLKAVLQGRKELFRGLAIYDRPYDWKAYPVVHLSFGDYTPMKDTAEKVDAYLRDKVSAVAETHGVILPTGCDAATALGKLLDTLGQRSQVVVLVDEYDKPIIDNIGNIGDKQVKGIVTCLKGFYSVLKDRNVLERLLFITGVSKFSHVTLFSDLNNLTDLTLNPEYAGMLGFTEEEVRQSFADWMPDAARAHGVTEDELMCQVLDWYDGYRFSRGATHVCNPVSITRFFANGGAFSNYWDSTGTPSFLLERMSTRNYDHEQALKEWYGESIFSAYETDRLDITGMLWQTGYLTIRGVRDGVRGLRYQLGFPDREVRDTFCLRLLEYYGNLSLGTGDSLVEKMQNAIMQDDPDGFLRLFQSVLANIDYTLHLRQEKYYQSIFFVVFLLLGSEIAADSCTNQGRIDAYICSNSCVYIFEFKLDKTAEEAVGQIKDRRYFEKFMHGRLPIRLIGVNFDSEKGRIDCWQEGTMG